MVSLIGYNSGMFSNDRLANHGFDNYMDYVEYTNKADLGRIITYNTNSEKQCYNYSKTYNLLCFAEPVECEHEYYWESDNILELDYIGVNFDNNSYVVNNLPTANTMNHSLFDLTINQIPLRIINVLEIAPDLVHNTSTNLDLFFIRKNIYNQYNLSYSSYLHKSDLTTDYYFCNSWSFLNTGFIYFWIMVPVLFILFLLYILCIRSTFKRLYNDIYTIKADNLKKRFVVLANLSIIFSELKNTSRYEYINIEGMIDYIEKNRVDEDIKPITNSKRKDRKEDRKSNKKNMDGDRFFSLKTFLIINLILCLSCLSIFVSWYVIGNTFAGVQELLKVFENLDT